MSPPYCYRQNPDVTTGRSDLLSFVKAVFQNKPPFSKWHGSHWREVELRNSSRDRSASKLITDYVISNVSILMTTNQTFPGLAPDKD